jgi:nitroimidazol reductase NimA-like FMN-containing flavoprotein (pyridoxamine 5'-phosphate oxidase superfamily)
MTTAEATMTTTAAPDHAAEERQRRIVRKAIAKQSFLTLATSSAANRPHVAGLLYAEADGALYMSTHGESIKARNVRENNRVAITIPIRKYPLVPPLSVQFQATAELLEPDDPRLTALVAAGKLKAVTSHGELDLPGGCFIKVTPNRRIVTYGLGVPLIQFIREPLNALKTVDMADDTGRSRTNW